MNLDFKTQFGLNFENEITVDLFAGGGGASTGAEIGTDRPIDIAINHDADAISMHTVNHPAAKHYISDVYEVDPVEACAGRPVGHLHASPDCTHHSQAAGGQPRKQAIRSLSWVVHKWAGKVRPRLITLENVEQILYWSPLVAKRCKETGRVMRLDGSVAATGEHTPIQNQFLVPDKRRRGHNWEHFVGGLRRMGYAVQWRKLKACDYGAPTTRERLYLIARCDGQPIVWPKPTHAKNPGRGQKPWRTAAECIDWSLRGQSIFGRKRPLADATMRRIAKGIKKYVIDAAEPFIVVCNHGRDKFRGHSVHEPLRTITAAHDATGVVEPVLAPFISTYYGQKNPNEARGSSMDAPIATQTTENRFALASAVMVGCGGRAAQSNPRGVDDPMATLTAKADTAMITAYLAQMNGGFNTNPGHDARDPMSTITNTGSQQQLVAASLVHLHANCDARAADDPLRTIGAGGQHHGLCTAFLSRQFGASVGQGLEEPAPTTTAGGGGKSALVELALSPEDEAGALRCAAFLMQYYGEGGSQLCDLTQPMHTIPTRDRLALVTVWIAGDPYVIVDIRLRMLQPRELYRAQGFPDSYVIDRGHDGRHFAKYQQVRFVGNSVSPPPMAAILAANYQVVANDNGVRAAKKKAG